MLKRRNIKNKGKIQLSLYFQELKKGDKVAIVREHALNPKFPKSIQGKTGVVTGTRGKAYLVQLRTGGLNKVYIVKGASLKKLK